MGTTTALHRFPAQVHKASSNTQLSSLKNQKVRTVMIALRFLFSVSAFLRFLKLGCVSPNMAEQQRWVCPQQERPDTGNREGKTLESGAECQLPLGTEKPEAQRPGSSKAPGWETWSLAPRSTLFPRQSAATVTGGLCSISLLIDGDLS